MARKTVRIEPSDRAQLMLVGAVAIALVLVGIVVVYNTVLFSDTQSATATIDDSRQVESFSQQVKKDIRTLAVKLNASNNLSQANLTSAVRNWSKVQGMSHATTNPTFVEVKPGTCSGSCSPGSTYDVTVVWESDDISFRDNVDITIPNAGLGSTIYFSAGGKIRTIDGNGSPVNTLSSTKDPTGIGPAEDITGDGTVDIPYVNDSGVLKLANSTGEMVVADGSSISGSIYGGSSAKTRLAVGEWDGSSKSIFFVDSNNDNIYRTTPSGPPVKVRDLSSGTGAQAVIGVANIDGDSEKELIYANSDQDPAYIDGPGGSSVKIADPSSSNVGIGSGSLADFDGDGISSISYVGDSGEIRIYGADESKGGEGSAKITSDSTAAKSPTTAADVDSDGKYEIIYLTPASNCELKYIDNVNPDKVSPGNVQKDLVDDTGTQPTGSCQTGVVS